MVTTLQSSLLVLISTHECYFINIYIVDILGLSLFFFIYFLKLLPVRARACVRACKLQLFLLFILCLQVFDFFPHFQAVFFAFAMCITED